MRGALKSLPVALLLLLTACSGETVQAVKPDLQFEPAAVDFGTVPVLQTRTLSLKVTNAGRAPLNLKNVALLDEVDGKPGTGGIAAFKLDPSWMKQVGAAVTAEVKLTFQPADEAPYAASLLIESDDPTRPRIVIPVTGIGSTKAVIEVAWLGHPGEQALDWGRVGEGRVALEALEFKSTGTAELVIESLTLEGAGEFQFAGSSRTPVTLAKGAALQLPLRCAPKEGAAELLEGVLVVKSTDPQRRELRFPLKARTNRAPVAAIADPGPLAPGQIVTLDGTGSTDADGDLPLAFADEVRRAGWVLARTPVNSEATLVGADTARPALTLDLPGTYVVRLVVSDATGLASLRPAEVRLLAKPAEALAVEVVWDNPDSDIDLHFVPKDGALGTALDVWANNKRPDYGDGTGPVLRRDALDHFGPEELVWAAPNAGEFDVWAVFYSAHGSATPATNVTVRVYVFGEVVAEKTRQLTAANQRWQSVRIAWPGGAVTPLDRLQ